MKILIHLAMVVSLGSVAGVQREPAEQSPSSQAVLAKPCRSIVLNGELSAGERFEKRINKSFVFRLDPHFIGPDGNISSWEISLARADDKNRDYIYPVNPPLRFNGLQILGPSYGEDTKSSLSHPHEMHFLLSDNDYDCLWPLVTNALWPDKAPDPDKPADQYVNALESLPTGELKLIVVSYLADQATGSIQQRPQSHRTQQVNASKHRPNAPPECLRAIYEESLALGKPSLSSQGISTDEGFRNLTYSALGSHSNTPVDVLEDMVNGHEGHLGTFAFRNPKLPKQEKVDFLERSSLSPLASERLLAANDADTPTSALRRLATDHDLPVIDGLFQNPNTSDDVFEGFAHVQRLAGWQGDIESFHKKAEAELAKRRRPDATAK